MSNQYYYQNTMADSHLCMEDAKDMLPVDDKEPDGKDYERDCERTGY